MSNNNIQNKMFKEIKDKNLFGLAVKHGFDYQQNNFKRNVYPTDKALEDLKNFEEQMPVNPSPADEILYMLNRFGSPATSAQTGGRYFGFVNGGVVPAGLAARLLSDFWDQNTAMQVISPVCSKLEIIVESWLKEIFNLPENTAAGFVSGTSMATFCGLAAARYRLLERQGWDINAKGLFNAPPLRIVAARQAHSTVLKAVSLLGFGRDNIEWVEADDQGRIIPEKIPSLDKNTILILQAGNVNTGSFDAFDIICEKAKKTGAWIHIDGAFGLWAGAAEKLKYLTKSIEKADSWSVDAHKTLNTPYDNGIVLCADREALSASLHMTGAYIIKGNERDGMYYTPEMSRRARVIELWATMKSLGRKGISEMIFGMHQRAVQFADELKNAGFEILNDIVFNQVLAFYRDSDAVKAILKKIQKSGVCWCGGSKWQDKDVIRISVCSWVTTPEDVTLSVKSFADAKNALSKL